MRPEQHRGGDRDQVQLLDAAEILPGGRSALSVPARLPVGVTAATVTLRAIFAPGATGGLVAIVTAEGDTQGGQTLALYAPGTDEPQQTTMPLALLAAEAVQVCARNGTTGPARGVTVMLATRPAQPAETFLREKAVTG